MKILKDLPDNVIPFPIEKVRQPKKIKSYHEIIHGTDHEDLTDDELIFCLVNTPLSLLGDAYDEKFWTRRIAAILRLGVSLDHPGVKEVFKNIDDGDEILFEKDHFDISVRRGKEIVSIAEMKCLSDLGKDQLYRYNQKLKKKKSEKAERIVITMFDLDVKEIPDPWYELSLSYFSDIFADMADILTQNPEISNDFNNCHDFLVLLEEMSHRFDEDIRKFCDDNNSLMRSKKISISSGFFKPMDRVVKNLCAYDISRELQRKNIRHKVEFGNTRGSNLFNVSTNIFGIEAGIQYQNNSVKLFRNSTKSSPMIDEKIRKIAEELTGRDVRFTSDRGKGFRSIRLNKREEPIDAWSIEGHQFLRKTINDAMKMLNQEFL